MRHLWLVYKKNNKTLGSKMIHNIVQTKLKNTKNRILHQLICDKVCIITKNPSHFLNYLKIKKKLAWLARLVDIQINHNLIKSWVEMLKIFNMIYRILKKYNQKLLIIYPWRKSPSLENYLIWLVLIDQIMLNINKLFNYLNLWLKINFI